MIKILTKNNIIYYESILSVANSNIFHGSCPHKKIHVWCWNMIQLSVEIVVSQDSCQSNKPLLLTGMLYGFVIYNVSEHHLLIVMFYFKIKITYVMSMIHFCPPHLWGGKNNKTQIMTVMVSITVFIFHTQCEYS